MWCFVLNFKKCKINSDLSLMVLWKYIVNNIVEIYIIYIFEYRRKMYIYTIYIYTIFYNEFDVL